MPDHNHGSGPTPGEALGSGIYSVNPVYLYMVGFWQVKIAIQALPAATSAGPADGGGGTSAAAPATSDNAIFPICIPG
jgi:hypothetical protein